MENCLSTGCAPIDDILGDGFRFGDVSLIYGEAATGKTTLALSCIANHLRSDQGNKAYYIDSDQRLSTRRLVQVTVGDDSLLERLLIWRPQSFTEQADVIEGLLELLPQGRVPVVVDSITGPYRLEAGQAERTFSANKQLNRQLGFLAETAKAKGAAVLVVGQVHSVLGFEASRVEPVAQRLLRYWSDTVLKLETTSMRGLRQALLEKPKRIPSACRFRLGATGLEGPDEVW